MACSKLGVVAILTDYVSVYAAGLEIEKDFIDALQFCASDMRAKGGEV